MMIALVALPVVALADFGEGASVSDILRDIDPNRRSLFGGTSALAIIAAAAWGLGYFGQPHIIVRCMAIRAVKDIPTARFTGLAWMGISLVGAIAVGLIGRAWFSVHATPLTDPATVFIVLGQVLLHPLALGFLLSAILAAIMRTISAQLLVPGSALTEAFNRLFVRRQAGATELVHSDSLSIGAGAGGCVIAAH